MKQSSLFAHGLRLRVFCCLLIAAMMLGSVMSCRPEYTPVGVVSQDYVPLINSNPWTTLATYSSGQTVSLELQYTSYSPIREILFFQIASRRVGTATVADTSVVLRTPYMAAFSATKQCDTLLLNYTVPDSTRLSRVNLVNVRLGVTVANQNNLSKLRTTSTFTVR
jgi:hypothetical protein